MPRTKKAAVVRPLLIMVCQKNWVQMFGLKTTAAKSTISRSNGQSFTMAGSIANRLLHPGPLAIRIHRAERLEAMRHQPDGQPGVRFLLSTFPSRIARCPGMWTFQEERPASASTGQRRAKNVADKARIFGPVHAELKLLHDAGDNAHGEVDHEELAPELGHALVHVIDWCA